MKRLVPEPIKEKLKRRIPLGRFGLIKDIETAAEALLRIFIRNSDID